MEAQEVFDDCQVQIFSSDKLFMTNFEKGRLYAKMLVPKAWMYQGSKETYGKLITKRPSGDYEEIISVVFDGE